MFAYSGADSSEKIGWPGGVVARGKGGGMREGRESFKGERLQGLLRN
jgi:hypothetical protein